MKTNQQHTPGEWRISKHATPAHSPQFGIYAGDSGRDLATVKGENAEADNSTKAEHAWQRAREAIDRAEGRQ